MIRPVVLTKLLLGSALLMTPLHALEIPFYVGTNHAPGKLNGILRSSLDSDTGKISPPVTVADIRGPSFLGVSADGRFLYAAIEKDGGEVAAFKIQDDRSLTLLNAKPAGGKGTCHVWADKAHVFASNYSGGNVTCLSLLPDGSLGEERANITFTGSGPNPVRQQKPYAHGAVPSSDGKFVYVCDLGTDQVWIFRFNRESGQMQPAEPPSGKVPPGGGPRHPALSPLGEFLYVNNEMGMSVSAFERNPETGELRLLQTIPTLPEGASHEGASTSGLVMHPTGKWLYVSNRGHNSITVYGVQPDGTLKFLQNAPSVVDMPREFLIDPSGMWLVAGGQKDGSIATMKIHPADGTLTPADRIDTGAVPVSFAFLP